MQELQQKHARLERRLDRLDRDREMERLATDKRHEDFKRTLREHTDHVSAIVGQIQIDVRAEMHLQAEWRKELGDKLQTIIERVGMDEEHEEPTSTCP